VDPATSFLKTARVSSSDTYRFPLEVREIIKSALLSVSP
jgi:hypothetical protein